MKKIIFSLILTFFTVLLIELMSLAAHHIKFGGYSYYDIQIGKLKVIDNFDKGGVYTGEELSKEKVILKQILHPYVGYVTDGKRRKPNCSSNKLEDCYARIRTTTDKPFAKRSDDKLIIAILGGSFADAIGRVGSPFIKEAFAQYPQYKDREIIIYNLAAGGYKQPQQLTHLAFAYSLGAEFDMVINVDGFNEMATNYNNYRDRDVHPAFPASWNFRVASSMNKDFLELYSEKRSSQISHRNLAKFWRKPVVRHSPTMNFIWRLINQNYQQKFSDIEQRINASASKKKPREFAFEATGPDYNFINWEQFHKDTAKIWSNSSVAINALVEGQGGQYFHFLQPNQYIEGNKILSEWEQKNAVLPNRSYGNVYHDTYPTLLEESKRLTSSGIKYTDFTYVFKDIATTLYVDNCCHINEIGIKIICKKIVQRINDFDIDQAKQK